MGQALADRDRREYEPSMHKLKIDESKVENESKMNKIRKLLNTCGKFDEITHSEKYVNEIQDEICDHLQTAKNELRFPLNRCYISFFLSHRHRYIEIEKIEKSIEYVCKTICTDECSFDITFTQIEKCMEPSIHVMYEIRFTPRIKKQHAMDFVADP